MLEAYIHGCGIIFAHKKETHKGLVTETHKAIMKLIADYRLTCLILPIAMKEVVCVYDSSEETEAQES